LEWTHRVVADLHDAKSTVAGVRSFELSDEDATENNENESYENQIKSLFVAVRYESDDPEAWERQSFWRFYIINHMG
jgi:hypothetical protein